MSLAGYNEPLNPRDDMVTADRKPSPAYMRWIEQAQGARLNNTPVMADPLTVLPQSDTNQAGTIGGSQTAGVYQVLAYLEVAIEDTGGAPTVQLTVTFTHNGKSLQRLYPVLSGSLVANNQGVSDVIQIDANTTIGYVLTRVDGATPGLFQYTATMGALLILPVQG